MTKNERILALLELVGPKCLSESVISEICVIASHELMPLLQRLEANEAIVKQKLNERSQQMVYRITAD